MPNRLASATSPYLLQHADNPVDWWPWSAAAFDEARARDVPVLLSVGYAACHWCHVMAHESFEDAETAALMNERFVNIKVDREERPDIDAVYMTATQAMTGHGGWPMTCFLTPAAEPFHCGTYFPPTPRPGMPSFRQLLTAVDEAWTTGGAEVREAGGRIVAQLREQTDATGRFGRRRDRARRRGHVDARLVRPRQRWFRWGAQVPAVDGAGVPAAPPRAHRLRRGTVHCGGFGRGDGGGRHQRPARGRLRALQRRRGLGRAAFREDALRQRVAAAALPAPVAAHRRAALARGGRRDRRVPGPRPRHRAGRVRRVAGRRHRRRRGPHLRLDARAAARGARPDRRRLGGRAARRHRGGHVRARQLNAADARRAGRRPALGQGADGAAGRARRATAARPRRQGGHRVERPGDRRAGRGGSRAGRAALGARRHRCRATCC